MSDLSSPVIPDSLFYSNDFMLGSGMVIIQPSSKKIVVVHDPVHDYWFLPKGRKDRGESLEAAALREAHEESGYRPQFLPLYSSSNQPCAPGSNDNPYTRPHTEPIYVSTTFWGPRGRQGRPGDHGGIYFTFWYVGQIAEDAVRELDTGMVNEKHFVSHLLDYEEAYEKLQGPGCECMVVQTAFDLWNMTVEELAKPDAPAPSEVYSWENQE